ncbi:MAG: nitroreductase/quinone reductase family protein [Micromonosporaceae bacterium]
MPSDRFLKTMNAVHRAAIRITRGRLGKRVAGMPTLTLTTIGRKSGRPHSVMLTAPVVDGDMIVIVASRGGDPTHPAWYFNLRERPDVEVSFQNAPKRTMTARTASPEERAALWPRVTSTFRGYAGYQRRTTREIPLVVLTPA